MSQPDYSYYQDSPSLSDDQSSQLAGGTLDDRNLIREHDFTQADVNADPGTINAEKPPVSKGYWKNLRESWDAYQNGEYGPNATKQLRSYNHKNALKQLGIRRPSVIIMCALIFLVTLEELTGKSVPFGFSELEGSADSPQPEKGDCFTSSAKELTEVHSALRLAFPETWTGAAAYAYADANEALIDLVRLITFLDSEMQIIARDQACVVKETRLGLGILQDFCIPFLIRVYFMEQYIELLPLAFAVANAVAKCTLVAGVGLVINCVWQSDDNADKTNRFPRGYGDVTKAAQWVIDAYPDTTESHATRPSGRHASRPPTPYFADLFVNTPTPPTGAGMPTAAAPANGASRACGSASSLFNLPAATRTIPAPGQSTNISRRKHQDRNTASAPATRPGEIDDAGASSGTHAAQRAPFGAAPTPAGTEPAPAHAS